MARTAIVPTQLVDGAGVNVAAAPVTIDATLVTNGVSITGGGAKKGAICIRVANTSGAARDVTIQSGGFPGAGTTDLVVEVAATTGVQVITIGASALYEQTDESYHVDFESGFTGTILVTRVPR